jgi:hypothetical protein
VSWREQVFGPMRERTLGNAQVRLLVTRYDLARDSRLAREIVRTVNVELDREEGRRGIRRVRSRRASSPHEPGSAGPAPAHRGGVGPVPGRGAMGGPPKGSPGSVRGPLPGAPSGCPPLPRHRLPPEHLARRRTPGARGHQEPPPRTQTRASMGSPPARRFGLSWNWTGNGPVNEASGELPARATNPGPWPNSSTTSAPRPAFLRPFRSRSSWSSWPFGPASSPGSARSQVARCPWRPCT